MDPEDLSSLHSSPSPIRRHPASTTVSTTASPSEPTIPDLISTESTEPHQNLLEPEHDRNTGVKTPEYKSVELRTIEQNPTDTSQVELDWSSTELVENTQDCSEVESTDREHNHSPVRIPSIEDQANHSPDEAADPPERLQSPSPIDPACDHHNHVPTELSSDQDQLQSCSPIDPACDHHNHVPTELSSDQDQLQSCSPIDPACDHHDHVPTELSSDQDQLQSCSPIDPACDHHNHVPTELSSDQDQLQSCSPIDPACDHHNHVPTELSSDQDQLQSCSPIDPACDHHNHVPTELSSDQDQLQSCNPIEPTCIERQQNESQVDFIRTLLPNFSPAELTHGLGGPDADRRHQGDRQSPSPKTQNQRQIPKQDHGTDNLVRSPELDNGDRGSESWTERECNHGNRGTGGDLDKYQRSSRVPPHNNNNHIRVKSPDRDKRAVGSPPAQSRGQLFALYNHTGELSSSLRSYSLRVPLGLQREAGLVTEVDAHWLDHMTQHFISGARLIDGFFHLGDDNDSGVFSVDIVFIFQSSSEETPPTSYDAIVVEQWTIVDGVVVRTDYIPLLQSLAPYGWRLMCVLPTPIVKTNSDGSLSTKQILFLQRPTLQRKRKDFKKLNLRGRNKAKKNSAGEMLKEERKNMSPVMERGMDEQKKNTEEEESEARRNWDNNRNEKGRTVERGGLKREEEERECETESQEDFPQGTEGVATDLNQEVEWENGKVPLARQEKAVRFVYVNQKNDEVKSEKITQQLSERALFSGVC
eukprot:XP_013998446.1 PREDICTED: uncharacterized protein LOC106570535 isoform X2 [Salmo salar]